jgi:transposase
LGHTVRLIPPAYVKPYVKRQKNDMADAEAICEAAQRPTMRFVPVKDEAQQANGVVFRARDLLVQQRTQGINALRGHLSEYGYVVPQGITHADALIAHVEDPDTALPASARMVLKVLIATFRALERQIQELDTEVKRRAKADPVARRLMTIPGVGPIVATAITALVPAPEGFRAGRDFAAWLGLTPLQRSTGGKQRLGAVSKRGERTIRRLLIIGASAVIKQACLRGAPAGAWLAQMLRRKPRMLVSVALARRGRDNQDQPRCLEHARVFRTRPANSHTGPRRRAVASEAGQMAASDHAPPQSRSFPLPGGGRPQMAGREARRAWPAGVA